MLDKDKATKEALDSVKDEGNSSPERKRIKVDEAETKKDTQNKKEPFKPPYVPELYVGCVPGLEGEDGMSILVSLG